MVWRPIPSSSPATASITTVPPIAVAADRPAATAASARDLRPGKASASPMRNPAAPEIMIANNSVVPWIISQPMKL